MDTNLIMLLKYIFYSNTTPQDPQGAREGGKEVALSLLILVLKGIVKQNCRGDFVGRWWYPPPQKVINLPRTYEKLPCKGVPYRFSG